jgi:hypothetical protein
VVRAGQPPGCPANWTAERCFLRRCYRNPYFRNVRVINRKDRGRRPLANVGGGTRTPPSTPRGVPIYLLDHFGPGRHAKVVSTRAADLLGDGESYRAEPPLTGDLSRVAEVRDVAFPTLLEPANDLPPSTVITGVSRAADGSLHVRGTACSVGPLKSVRVNGQPARPVASDLSEWEVTLRGEITAGRLVAVAEDASGLKEKTPHELPVDGDCYAAGR